MKNDSWKVNLMTGGYYFWSNWPSHSRLGLRRLQPASSPKNRGNIESILRNLAVGVLSAAFLLPDAGAEETVFEELFSEPLTSRWELSGAEGIPWAVDTARQVVFCGDNVGGRERHSFLTAPLDAPCESWTVTLRYGWLYGAGESNGCNGFAVLDGEGNGYGLYIEQGSREASIQLMKFTRGSSFEIGTFDKPFNDLGIHVGGHLTALRLQWAANTGELSLFIGKPGEDADLVSELVGTATDISESKLKFTRFQLQSLCHGGQQSAFSEIVVESDLSAAK